MSERDNPFLTPIPRGVRYVQGILRVVVVIQCWGIAAGRLHLQKSLPLVAFFADLMQWSPQDVGQVEEFVAYASILCGLCTLIRPCWPVLIPVLLWQGGVMVLANFNGNGASAWLDPAIMSTQIAAPLALLLIDFWPPRIRPTLFLCVTVVGLLRFATAVTFAAYGLEALRELQRGGHLVQLIQDAALKAADHHIGKSEAQFALGLCGLIQFALALSLLTSRNRSVALAIILLAGLYAFLPTLAYGDTAYDQSLIRVSEAGAPLAMLAFWMAAIQEREPVMLPEEEDDDD